MVFQIPLFHASPGEKEELDLCEFLFSRWLQGKKRNWNFASSSFPGGSRGKRGTGFLRVPLFHASPEKKEELSFYEFLFSRWLQRKKRNWNFASSSFSGGSMEKRGTELL